MRTAIGLLVALALLAREAPARTIHLDHSFRRIRLLINESSANPAHHSIRYEHLGYLGDLYLDPSTTLDDPVANGAAAVVFSATDRQCVIMGPAPATLSGWTPTKPIDGITFYQWRDRSSGSRAIIKGGSPNPLHADKLRFTRKGGISFGLDGTPQGEVEVQIRFGNSPDLFCTRFAAPSLADDTPTRYESTDVVFMGCPTPVPAFCGPCDPPGA